MLAEKKKRSGLGLHIFLQKSRCSLKKKGLQFNFISNFPIFQPKSRCFLKKKVFTSISSLISLFFSQNQGVLQKKGLYSESPSEQTFAANPKLYVLFSRGAPKKRGGLRQLPHSPHPISTTAYLPVCVVQ